MVTPSKERKRMDRQKGRSSLAAPRQTVEAVEEEKKYIGCVDFTRSGGRSQDSEEEENDLLMLLQLSPSPSQSIHFFSLGVQKHHIQVHTHTHTVPGVNKICTMLLWISFHIMCLQLLLAAPPCSVIDGKRV